MACKFSFSDADVGDRVLLHNSETDDLVVVTVCEVWSHGAIHWIDTETNSFSSDNWELSAFVERAFLAVPSAEPEAYLPIEMGLYARKDSNLSSPDGENLYWLNDDGWWTDADGLEWYALDEELVPSDLVPLVKGERA